MVKLAFAPSETGLKSFAEGRFFQRIEILATGGKQLLRHVERDPGAHLNLRLMFLSGRIELEVLLRPTRLDDGPRIGRRSVS